MDNLYLYQQVTIPRLFYSQQNEDFILLNKYLNYRNGFFIELGAMDGLCYSNTFFFEHYLNWTGILIEPTEQYFELIKNRPNCKNYKFAISEKQGLVEFVGDKCDGHLSAMGGIKSSMDYNQIKEFDVDKKTSLIESVPINKLLSGVKKVDLFSIDVEGGEYEVLKTFNWDIPVYIILIEMLTSDEEKNKKCRELLIDKQFTFEDSIGCNEIWINKNFKHE